MTTDANTTDINSSENSSDVQQPFPNSRKVYVQGSRADIRVPMREITLSPTQTTTGVEENPPVMVYDTSGPYTDPDIEIDLEKGLDPIRQAWITERDDTEALTDLSSDYGRERRENEALDSLRFAHLRSPLRAKAGHNVSQMFYARQGIITPEMEFVAIREISGVNICVRSHASIRDRVGAHPFRR